MLPGLVLPLHLFTLNLVRTLNVSLWGSRIAITEGDRGREQYSRFGVSEGGILHWVSAVWDSAAWGEVEGVDTGVGGSEQTLPPSSLLISLPPPSCTPHFYPQSLSQLWTCGCIALICGDFRGRVGFLLDSFFFFFGWRDLFADVEVSPAAVGVWVKWPNWNQKVPKWLDEVYMEVLSELNCFQNATKTSMNNFVFLRFYWSTLGIPLCNYFACSVTITWGLQCLCLGWGFVTCWYL